MVKMAMVKRDGSKSKVAELQPPSIPDGVIKFLIQNSPSSKVQITNEWYAQTDFS
jgi:hypothetical protein